MRAAMVGAAVLAAASTLFYFSTTVRAAKNGGTISGEAISALETSPLQMSGGRLSAAHLSGAQSARTQKSMSVPLFFEPNQGQTAPQVKFLARGSGYGLFLTSDEAVLELHRPVSLQHLKGNAKPAANSVIRMRLDGANSGARVAGVSRLAGKSNYFIGNDPSKWRQNIPQFGRVEYQAIYQGVDLVYYGNEGQLEYDFRVAPGADPKQIALKFDGAKTRIDGGDLILSTASGDVRFHAPRVYQPAVTESGQVQANGGKTIAGSFRQLADNKIGFAIGDYDHSRELVIDPVLSYSTYIGGSGTEGLVQVAVDSGGLIYLAGSTTSSDFPLSTTDYPNNPPYQSTLNGTQNIFIAVINPTLQPPTYTNAQQLVYATYLGGSGVDSLAGVQVDSAFSIYVAGSTTSPNFPTSTNAFQPGPETGTHGFLSKLSFTGVSPNLVYGLTYSTYLSGNGVDNVTGLAIDASCNRQSCNAYVTGNTTSTNPVSDGFPANPNGYQLQSNSPGFAQFFASKINTTGSGYASMLYSTYLGGGNPVGAIAVGGGIAVDPIAPSTNMYITGTTNMLSETGANGEVAFPLVNAQQSCLNESSVTTSPCPATGTNTDGIVAKINPNYQGQQSLIYSTYIGGSGNDTGNAIAVDTSSNVYVTGSTASGATGDWACLECTVTGFQSTYGGGGDAYIAEIGNLNGSIYPLIYFTYLGGSGPDVGNSIQVDALQAAHVAGNTSSQNLPVTTDAFQAAPGGGGDAFVALINTTMSGPAPGDYVSYLGGSQLDQGTGIALDIFNATYVAGSTVSPNFPVAGNPFQGTLNSGSQDAFVSKVGAASTLTLSNSANSPSPSPVPAGTPVAFTFNIVNNGPDNASNVNFYATINPTSGLAQIPTAQVTAGSGSCTALQGSTINCFIPTLAACSQPTNCSYASVEVDVTPSATGNLTTISVSGQANANGGALQGSLKQSVNVVDFSIYASTSTPSVSAGNTATVAVNFCPTQTQYGYSGTITPSETISPTMVTASTPVFYPTPVVLSGVACGSTTLSIATVARPVNTGGLLRRGPFYAMWLPIGGLSLAGLGAVRKRRRWLAGIFLVCAIAGVITLQACGSAATSISPTGGTAAGTYNVTVTGTAGSGASHQQVVQIVVF